MWPLEVPLGTGSSRNLPGQDPEFSGPVAHRVGRPRQLGWRVCCGSCICASMRRRVGGFPDDCARNHQTTLQCVGRPLDKLKPQCLSAKFRAVQSCAIDNRRASPRDSRWRRPFKSCRFPSTIPGQSTIAQGTCAFEAGLTSRKVMGCQVELQSSGYRGKAERKPVPLVGKGMSSPSPTRIRAVPPLRRPPTWGSMDPVCSICCQQLTRSENHEARQHRTSPQS